MKKIMILIVFVLLIFLVGLTVFKSKYESNKKIYSFVEYDVSVLKLNKDEDIYYQDTNFEKIRIVGTKSINFDNRKTMKGYIYINNDKYLAVHNENKKSDYIVADIKFKTIYTKDYNYDDNFEIYAIGDDDKLYIVNLEDNSDNYVSKFSKEIDGEYTNFMNLELRKDKYSPESTIFALSKDGSIYNVNTGLLYNPNTISLYDKIHVYDDKTMTNIYGKVIAGKDGVPYKIKYIFNVVLEDEFIDNTSYIVITEDDKFLYFNEDISKVYELNRKVKKVEFDKYDPYIEGLLTLTFNMNSKMSFNVECNEYFCVN